MEGVWALRVFGAWREEEGSREDTEGPSLAPSTPGWREERGLQGRCSPYGVYYKLLSSCKD